MSQWHNPSWPSQTAAQRSAPEKSEQIPYNLSNHIRHPYLPSEFDPSASGDSHQFSSRPPTVNPMPHPADLHQPPSGAIPFSRAPILGRPGAVPDPQYAHIPSQQYPAPPSEYNQNNYHVPSEQWDAPTLSGYQSGQADSTTSMKKSRLIRESDLGSSDSTNSSRTSSRANSRPRQGSFSGQKGTKRSRMGCLTCRQRKKRCCETRPKCSECQRLRLICQWPKPGTEHKNKPKELKNEENMMDHHIYGKIKVLRGIVEYRSN